MIFYTSKKSVSNFQPNIMKENTIKKIAIDSGKFATKGIARNQSGEIDNVYFETKISKTDETEATFQDDTFVVNIQGEDTNYKIGKFASEDNDFNRSKASDVHKIATYTAIHKLANDGDNVALVVGCPISEFKSKELREKFENMFELNKKVTLTVDGVTKTFTIIQVNSLPETSGYIFRNMDSLEDEITTVIDIGGLNANASQYDGANMIPNQNFTYDSGINVLKRELRDLLNDKFLTSLTIRDIDRAIKGKPLKYKPEETSTIINDYLKDYVVNLKRQMEQKQWEVEALDLVFVGGGSVLLEKQILEVFPSAIVSSQGVWDNVLGFGEIIDL